MATIEPRLIHLLNESTTPQLAHIDLPPLHALQLPTSVDRSLPHAGPDHAYRLDVGGADNAQYSSVDDVAATAEDVTSTNRRNDHRREGKTLGATSVHPLQLLLGENDAPEASHPANRAFDDGAEWLDDLAYKKRSRALNIKEDFVQLPQPVKKQKAAESSLTVPPIIRPLREPPPHAALFPPIASDSFVSQHSQGDQTLSTVDSYHHAEHRVSGQRAVDTDKNACKVRKRATKPRRKWSEEETKHLLLGVNRHGVGKWTSILEDKEFRFNERTAGDLKDRFRTCCPDELRGTSKGSKSSTPPRVVEDSLHSETLCLPADQRCSDPAGSHSGSDGNHEDAESMPKMKKSRAHRKNLGDLAELGIHGPFKKSHRRERRPFSEQDDREILDGLDLYGPAWTKIQRDPRFHLSCRQPTDLRDRVRNKYPGIYHRIEKGIFQPRDVTRAGDTLEPSIHMTIDHTLQPSQPSKSELHVSRTNSREDMPRLVMHNTELLESSQLPHSMEFGEIMAPHLMSGEMDISRLLLDDGKIM